MGLSTCPPPDIINSIDDGATVILQDVVLCALILSAIELGKKEGGGASKIVFGTARRTCVAVITTWSGAWYFLCFCRKKQVSSTDFKHPICSYEFVGGLFRLFTKGCCRKQRVLRKIYNLKRILEKRVRLKACAQSTNTLFRLAVNLCHFSVILNGEAALEYSKGSTPTKEA